VRSASPLLAAFGSIQSRWGRVSKEECDAQLLRHTHATLALQAGVHPKVVCERLRHATVSITLDTYSHATSAMQEEAAALIAGLVFAEE
jgi:integrase